MHVDRIADLEFGNFRFQAAFLTNSKVCWLMCLDLSEYCSLRLFVFAIDSQNHQIVQIAGCFGGTAMALNLIFQDLSSRADLRLAPFGDPEIVTLLLGSQSAFRVTPSRNLLVVSAQQHIRHAEPPKFAGSRVLRPLEQPVDPRKRILSIALLISQNARHQATTASIMTIAATSPPPRM